MAKLQNIDLVNEMIAQRYINVNKHPEYDLYVMKYSKSCTLNGVWNPATCQCRGIIVDGDNNIIARPFEKFFNYEELEGLGISVPQCGFSVYEKLDGSMGTLYFAPDGKPYIATQGSFVSDQAVHATDVLYSRYGDKLELLDKTKTYIFEIIYNEDKHVVTYGDTDDIILLGVIDTETGAESDIYEWSHVFTCAKRYDGIEDYTKIREMFDDDNKEGFVVRFDNGFRMKVKFEKYFRLHALMWNLSEKSILEMLMSGDMSKYDEVIDNFNEENKIFYNAICDKYNAKYAEIEITSQVDVDMSMGYYSMPLDGEKAQHIKNHTKYPSVVFAMVHGKEYKHIIWGIVKDWYKEQIKNKNIEE